MTIHTINTIEVSTLCQLKCKYCINPLMKDKGIMTEDIFEQSLYWLEILCRRGTQQEVNMNGNGEATLDPNLPRRVRKVKDIVGDRTVELCSNAVGVTREMVIELLDNGLDKFDLSPHNPYEVRRLVSETHDLKINGIINMGSFTASHNWAGQLPEQYQIKMTYTLPCLPMIEGRAHILSDGKVVPCCYDRGMGLIGTVFDDDLLSRPLNKFELCKTCHQIIPGGIL